MTAEQLNELKFFSKVGCGILGALILLCAYLIMFPTY